ncbi:MAG: hypothetical protein R3E87_14510 [Burkholderiaceae bacterium]
MPITDSIKGATANAAEQIQHSSRDMAHETERAIRETVDNTAEQFGEQSNRYIGALSAAVGEGARHLRDEGYDLSADTFDSVADTLSRSAKRLSRAAPDRLGSQLVGALREHPVITCGLLAGAGYALATLLRYADDAPAARRPPRSREGFPSPQGGGAAAATPTPAAGDLR